MRMLTVSLLFAIAVAATPLFAAAMSDTYVIAAAHARGAGGELWQSDVTLFNPNSTAVNVDALFVDSSGVPRAIGTTVAVAPGATAAVRDIVGTGGGQGAIVLSGNHPFVVVSRAYASTARGSFGESVVPLAEFFDAASYGAYLTGLASNGAMRTNIGIFAAADRNAPMTITISITNASGAAAGTRTLTIPAGGISAIQLPLASITADALDGATARVTITGGGGVAAAYASVVDNGTSDSMFIAGSSGVLPPAAAAAKIRDHVR